MLMECPIFIDDSPAPTVMQIRSKSRRLKSEGRLGMIVIDYLQLMNGNPRASSREQQISEMSRGLKALAKELDVPVIALSQLSREPEKRSGRQKRPQLSDLRESGAIEQDADVVMMLWADQQKTNVVHCKIAKQRNGPVGTRTLLARPDVQRFENYAGC